MLFWDSFRRRLTDADINNHEHKPSELVEYHYGSPKQPMSFLQSSSPSSPPKSESSSKFDTGFAGRKKMKKSARTTWRVSIQPVSTSSQRPNSQSCTYSNTPSTYYAAHTYPHGYSPPHMPAPPQPLPSCRCCIADTGEQYQTSSQNFGMAARNSPPLPDLNSRLIALSGKYVNVYASADTTSSLRTLFTEEKTTDIVGKQCGSVASHNGLRIYQTTPNRLDISSRSAVSRTLWKLPVRRIQEEVVRHIKSGDLKKVKYKMKHFHLDVNMPLSCTGVHLLSYACGIESSNLEIVEYLVSCGAMIDQTDQKCATAAQLACHGNKRSQKKRYAIVEYLISHGANIDHKCAKFGSLRNTIPQNVITTGLLKFQHRKSSLIICLNYLELPRTNYSISHYFLPKVVANIVVEFMVGENSRDPYSWDVIKSKRRRTVR